MVEHDLVITGGRVVDPAQGIDRRLDVAIKAGRIAALGENLRAKRRLDADGKIVCPGLIDLHVHVYEWVTNFGLNADDTGVNAGATTIVDQGSTGAWTYGGFKAYVIERARTDVRAFVSINLMGALKGGTEAERLHNPQMVDVDELAALAQADPVHIRGFKCHGESGTLSNWGLAVFEQAVEAGRRTGLPLYVHTGELFPVDEARRPEKRSVLPTILPLLKPGDVLAHVYSSMPDGIAGEGERVPAWVHEAKARGVRFDIGYGINFSYRIARRMIAEGIYPDTISSDLHGDFYSFHDERKLDYSLCGAMTRLLALGMPLERVVEAATATPAAILGDGEIGALKPGMKANLTVLEELPGDWLLRDGSGEALRAASRLMPAQVVMAGEPIIPSNRLLRDVCEPARG
ncbi:MAG TPA: amidohydrolase/deacetylase family metallohydrolase, partial [Stellaceae bacterium]|nr:amidohydrolase/deacetylase family metallohydrolase [Stellaceae bacterium]